MFHRQGSEKLIDKLVSQLFLLLSFGVPALPHVSWDLSDGPWYEIITVCKNVETLILKLIKRDFHTVASV